MSQYENNYYPNSGAGGGGGYLTGGSPSSQSGSPGGTLASRESNNLRPLTIAQVRKAEQAHTDAEWTVEGTSVGHITVVATVMSITIQTTNAVISINDGTGRMEARKWLTTNEEDGDSFAAGITDDMYIRVSGNIKVFGNKRYINATHVRPVSDRYEFYFHLAEAMAVTLMIERGMPSGEGKNAALSGTGGTVAQSGGVSSDYTTQTRAPSNQYAGLPPLQRDIMEFIATQPVTQEGINIHAIVRGARSSDDPVKISDALESLMDDGHLYTTIDEQHFQISS